MRSWREQKALTVQPMKCRMAADMVDILAE